MIDGGAVARVDAPTERTNPRTADLDVVPTDELVRLLHAEDALVTGAVEAALPALARLVDEAVTRVRDGGRVHYFGAGTPGRLAVLDAAELLPTFGVREGVVVAHQAGGAPALVHSVEDAEDDEAAGAADAADVTGADLVIGITASGRTPYVGAALGHARGAGAATALATSNPAPPLAGLADHLIVTDTGPEAITGSTRLKAGTAQKLVLNTFSTALMVRLGHTYRNLMVDVLPLNAKLRGRSIKLLREATGLPEPSCVSALDAAGDLKTALVLLLSTPDFTPENVTACREALTQSNGHVRTALTLTTTLTPTPKLGEGNT